MAAHAKPIMIQGTMSNAGKSLLAAGLCRLFKQDGYRVAPFKSQNMALNSFITPDGFELGRAQAVQAEACGIAPDVRMNPILLKPTTDMGSQIVVMGEPVGNMAAVDYFRKKKDYIPVIRKAYESLAEEYDIIVIEGAGSPAEINLKQDDIVNMGMARMADAPVLLAGDIDRGGVFAQLFGTVALLTQEEQDRILGLIINKFRGDPKILEPGLRMLEEKVHKPVLGVVPYLSVRIEEEDSLADSLEALTGRAAAEGLLDLAVIRLPKIANFTDFQALSLEPSAQVRYVTEREQLGRPDVVILPGTKSTMGDLKWLRESGLEGAILRLHSEGVPVVGICGGYQMMGQEIEDPYETEGSGSMRGMGILPTVTTFNPEKTMDQTEGITQDFGIPALAGKPIRGYEVHMGRTVPVNPAADGKDRIFSRLTAGADGFAAALAFGTYVHGVFDTEEFRGAFLSWLAERKGISLSGSGMDYRAFRESQYDHLAEALREHLDMEAIYRGMGLR